LYKSFTEYPIFGSGFGGYAGYTRNLETPWLYELTYFQLMYNFGVVGLFFIAVIFFIYIALAIKQLRIQNEFQTNDRALLVGLISFLIGTYSNPYLASFDFLLYLGMLPVLSQIYKNKELKNESK
jgi:hypothetical protein